MGWWSGFKRRQALPSSGKDAAGSLYSAAKLPVEQVYNDVKSGVSTVYTVDGYISTSQEIVKTAGSTVTGLGDDAIQLGSNVASSLSTPLLIGAAPWVPS